MWSHWWHFPPPHPLTSNTHPSEKNISLFHSLVSMSLTTIRQMASCLLCGQEIHLAWHKSIRLTSSYHYQIWGIICNQKWECANLAHKKKRHSRKKYQHVFCFENGFESNRIKPQIWPACTWHHSRWSLSVCVWPAWLNPSMWMHLWMHLSSATAASHLSSLLLSVPPPSQILSSVLPLCLPMLAPTRS